MKGRNLAASPAATRKRPEDAASRMHAPMRLRVVIPYFVVVVAIAMILLVYMKLFSMACTRVVSGE